MDLPRESSQDKLFTDSLMSMLASAPAQRHHLKCSLSSVHCDCGKSPFSTKANLARPENIGLKCNFGTVKLFVSVGCVLGGVALVFFEVMMMLCVCLWPRGNLFGVAISL